MLGCKKLWDIIPRCIIPPFLPWLCVSLRLAKVKGGKFPSPMSDTKRHRDQYQSYTWFKILLSAKLSYYFSQIYYFYFR